MTALPTASAGGNKSGPAAPPVTAKDDKASVGTGRANEPIKQVNDRTFILKNGIWTDTSFTDKMKLTPIVFLSDAYFKLLADHPEIKDYLAIGDRVVVVIGDAAYEIKPQ